MDRIMSPCQEEVLVARLPELREECAAREQGDIILSIIILYYHVESYRPNT